MQVYYLTGLGFLFLFAGGELLVSGGMGLSRALGVSPLLIGLLVISAGTSAPEFFIELRAGFEGSPALALGNIVGANIANMLLIAGMAASLNVLPTSPMIVFRDGGALLLSCLLLAVAAQDGRLGQVDGILFVFTYVAYAALSFSVESRRASAHVSFVHRASAQRHRASHPGLGILLVPLGVLLLFFGSNLIVDGATVLARNLHLSQAILGLTLLAVGTTLPELVATLVGVVRGHTQLVIGNLIGSCIFNTLIVLGATAAVTPLDVARELAREDVLFLIAAMAIFVPLLYTGWKLRRSEGVMLAALYFGYVAVLTWRASVA